MAWARLQAPKALKFHVDGSAESVLAESLDRRRRSSNFKLHAAGRQWHYNGAHPS